MQPLLHMQTCIYPHSHGLIEMARGVNPMRGLLVAASGFLCMHDHRPPGVSLNASLTLGCKAVPLACPSPCICLEQSGFQGLASTQPEQWVLGRRCWELCNYLELQIKITSIWKSTCWAAFAQGYTCRPL